MTMSKRMLTTAAVAASAPARAKLGQQPEAAAATATIGFRV